MNLLCRTSTPNRFFFLPRYSGGGVGRGLAKSLSRTPFLTRSTGGGKKYAPRDTGFQPVPSAEVRKAALWPVCPGFSSCAFFILFGFCPLFPDAEAA